MDASWLTNCRLCPRQCGADRRQARGVCGGGVDMDINLAMLHHGEEPPISGSRGSGTIFFSGCNLRCVYCQNYKTSQLGWGRPHSPQQLADMMLDLAGQGAHNINLVTPTHFAPQIKKAIGLARSAGLAPPVVWNSSGYESVQTLRAMAGEVDVYLADLRYGDSSPAARYSGAADYPEVARAALVEMHRQTGDLMLDRKGIACRGLLVRLLILPGNINRVDRSLTWIRDALGKNTWISLMAQYYPSYLAERFPEINRTVTGQDMENLRDVAEELGLTKGFCQEDMLPSPHWTPDFQPRASKKPTTEQKKTGRGPDRPSSR